MNAACRQLWNTVRNYAAILTIKRPSESQAWTLIFWSVGDIVYADTRLGGTLAKVVAVNVQEHTIDPKIRPLLKHITDGPLPPDKVPQPRPQAVTQMTLG